VRLHHCKAGAQTGGNELQTLFQLIDLCDEIAYNTADLDDGYAAGLISLRLISNQLPVVAALQDEIESKYPGANDSMKMNEIVRALVDRLVTGLVEGTVATARESGAENADDVRHAPRRLAQFSGEAAPVNQALKDFLRRHVYQSELVERDRQLSIHKLGSVFAAFLRHPDLLPDDYRELTEAVPLARAVCDYVAGMTDGFLLRTWEQLRSEGRLE